MATSATEVHGAVLDRESESELSGSDAADEMDEDAIEDADSDLELLDEAPSNKRKRSSAAQATLKVSTSVDFRSEVLPEIRKHEKQQHGGLSRQVQAPEISRRDWRLNRAEWLVDVWIAAMRRVELHLGITVLCCILEDRVYSNGHNPQGGPSASLDKHNGCTLPLDPRSSFEPCMHSELQTFGRQVKRSKKEPAAKGQEAAPNNSVLVIDSDSDEAAPAQPATASRFGARRLGMATGRVH